MTGGEAAEVSAEVITSDGSTCIMPDLQSPGRGHHSMSGFTLCGGFGVDQLTSCTTLSAGEWKMSHALNVQRWHHLSWNSPNGTLLMGGNTNDAYQTTELLSTTTSSSTQAFSLSYDTL